MIGRLLGAGAFLFAAVTGAFAQTAPLPEISTGGDSGWLKRSALFVSFAGMQVDDPRFSWVQRGRGDFDLFRYRQGRVNLLFDTELVMGSERRALDLNHVNVIIETSSSYRLGPIDLSLVLHHESRHVVDRESGVVPAWNTVGARAGHMFVRAPATIDVNVEYDRVVQHTFVDYTWTSQLTIRVDRTLRPQAHFFAAASTGRVGVDRAARMRGPQTGVRAEGGVHVAAERAGVDFFAAYERRVDGFPTSREPSSWLELGVRLDAR